MKRFEAADVRVGTEADIGSWMALVRRVRVGFPGLETETAILEHEATVRRFMARGEAICVMDGAAVVGVLLFSVKHNMICCLAVMPEYRRRGAASALLSRAIDALDQTRPMTVSTFREEDGKGPAPRALYQKFGFMPGELTVEFGYPNQVFTRG